MRIAHFYTPGQVVFSVELYPPRAKVAQQALRDNLPKIIAQNLRFISVTYGAGGGSQNGTLEICRMLADLFQKQNLPRAVLAHLTCVSHSKKEVDALLSALQQAGVENIMALRGDIPQGIAQFITPKGGFAYALDLVHYLRKHSPFGIGVAGYPEGHIEATNYQASLQHQIEKVRAGGEFIVSQFFTENRFFLKWRDDLSKEKVDIPVVAGVLPALSSKQMNRFAKMCGVQVAPPLLNGLERYAHQAKSAAQFGLEYALKQIETLCDEGVQGIHLYALNRLNPIRAVAGLLQTCTRQE